MPSSGSGTGTPVTGVTTVLEGQPFFSACWTWDSSAGAFVDRTNAARDPSDSAFTIFEDTADYLYLGSESRFDLAAFSLSTNGNVGTRTVQFYRNGTWTTFVPSNTFDFTTSGAETFDNLTNWTTLAFSNGTPHAAAPPDTNARYWIRMSVASITTSPTVSQIRSRPYAIYCTPTDVANLLQLSSDFSTTTRPTRNTIEDFIHSAQAYIDFRTKKSWRLKVKNDEDHEFNIAGIKLLERDVQEVYKLEIWNGSEYETKTQARVSDYFLVPDIGLIKFARFFLLPARFSGGTVPTWSYGWGEFSWAVRVTYLYGRNIYTDERDGGMVRDIAKKLAAIDVYRNTDYSLLIVSGSDKMTIDRKIESWKEECENRLDSLYGWRVM